MQELVLLVGSLVVLQPPTPAQGKGGFHCSAGTLFFYTFHFERSLLKKILEIYFMSKKSCPILIGCFLCQSGQYLLETQQKDANTYHLRRAGSGSDLYVPFYGVSAARTLNP